MIGVLYIMYCDVCVLNDMYTHARAHTHTHTHTHITHTHTHTHTHVCTHTLGI